MFRFNKNHIKMDMKKIRKVMSIFLACCLLLSINFETVFASDIETNTNADIMSLDGPSTTFDGRLFLDENGNYSGQLRSGFTTVTCVLSGRTGGIPTLYTIYIRWQGSNAVQAPHKYWIFCGNIGEPVVVNTH